MDSFLYIKKFLDDKIRELNRPIVITPGIEAIALDEGINKRQLQIVIARLNILIKRHNNNVFSSRINGQIASQVMKNEISKADMVNEQLTEVQRLMRPLLIPSIDQVSKVEDFGKLVDELPEGRYLFEQKGEREEPPEEEPPQEEPPQEEPQDNQQQSQTLDDILIQDDQPIVGSTHDPSTYKRTYPIITSQHIINNQSHEQHDLLQQQYDTLRLHLVQINERLQYKHQKLQYLQDLKSKLSVTLGIDLHQQPQSYHLENQIPQQVNKFRILVDMIKLKINDSNRQAILNQLQDM